MNQYPEGLLSPPIPVVTFVGLRELHNEIKKHFTDSSIRVLSAASEVDLPRKNKERRPYEGYKPSGILKRNWIMKHQQIVPATVVILHELNSNITDWRTLEQPIATSIEKAKIRMRGRNTKFVLALVTKQSTADIEVDHRIDDFLSVIRKRCELDTRSLFLFTRTNFMQSAQRLERLVNESSMQYYTDEVARIKSYLKNEISHKSQPFLVVRHQFKVAFNSEVLQDPIKAIKHYQLAYLAVHDISKADFSETEIKTVGDYINFKLCQLKLSTKSTNNSGVNADSAVRQFTNHIQWYKQQSGEPDMYFVHYAMIHRQYRMFAELLEAYQKSQQQQLQQQPQSPPQQQQLAQSAVLSSPTAASMSESVNLQSSVKIASMSQQPTSPSAQQQQQQQQQQTSIVIPKQHLQRRQHNPGFYYHAAATAAVARKKYAESLCFPHKETIEKLQATDPLSLSDDPESQLDGFIGQTDDNITGLSAPLRQSMREQRFLKEAAKELKIDHSMEIIKMLKKAYDHFAQHKLSRMIHYIASCMAEEYFASGRFELAKLKFFDHIVRTYRKEGQIAILTSILRYIAECSTRLNRLHDYIDAALELISQRMETSVFEKETLFTNLFGYIHNPNRASEFLSFPALEAPLLLDMEPDHITLQCKIQFERPQVYVYQPVGFRIMISSTALHPIRFSRLMVYFNESSYNVTLNDGDCIQSATETSPAISLEVSPLRPTFITIPLVIKDKMDLECLGVVLQIGGDNTTTIPTTNPNQPIAGSGVASDVAAPATPIASPEAASTEQQQQQAEAAEEVKAESNNSAAESALFLRWRFTEHIKNYRTVLADYHYKFEVISPSPTALSVLNHSNFSTGNDNYFASGAASDFLLFVERPIVRVIPPEPKLSLSFKHAPPALVNELYIMKIDLCANEDHIIKGEIRVTTTGGETVMFYEPNSDSSIEQQPGLETDDNDTTTESSITANQQSEPAAVEESDSAISPPEATETESSTPIDRNDDSNAEATTNNDTEAPPAIDEIQSNDNTKPVLANSEGDTNTQQVPAIQITEPSKEQQPTNKHGLAPITTTQNNRSQQNESSGGAGATVSSFGEIHSGAVKSLLLKFRSITAGTKQLNFRVTYETVHYHRLVCEVTLELPVQYPFDAVFRLMATRSTAASLAPDTDTEPTNQNTETAAPYMYTPVPTHNTAFIEQTQDTVEASSMSSVKMLTITPLVSSDSSSSPVSTTPSSPTTLMAAAATMQAPLSPSFRGIQPMPLSPSASMHMSASMPIMPFASIASSMSASPSPQQSLPSSPRPPPPPVPKTEFVIYEPILLTSSLSCTTPFPLVIKKAVLQFDTDTIANDTPTSFGFDENSLLAKPITEYTDSEEATNQQLPLSQSGGLITKNVLEHSDVFTLCHSLRALVASRDLNLGKLVLTLQRSKEDPYLREMSRMSDGNCSTTPRTVDASVLIHDVVIEMPLPSIVTHQPLISVFIDAPSEGKFEQPMDVRLTLLNNSWKIQELSVSIGETESFLFAGASQTTVTLPPYESRVLRFTVIPLGTGHRSFPQCTVKCLSDASATTSILYDEEKWTVFVKPNDFPVLTVTEDNNSTSDA